MEEKRAQELSVRYVCPNCLRTFLDNVVDPNRFCWKCGQQLKAIGKNENFHEKTP